MLKCKMNVGLTVRIYERKSRLSGWKQTIHILLNSKMNMRMCCDLIYNYN